MAKRCSVLNKRVAVVLTFVAACGVGVSVHMARTSQICFMAIEWRDATRRSYFSPRYRMASDLCSQIMEWAPDPQKIIDVLGPPSHTNFDEHADKVRHEDLFMRYPLGRNQRSLTSISQYYLLITYARDGRLKGVAIYPE